MAEQDKNTFNWGSAAISAGSNVINTLINQAFAQHNREENFRLNELAADNADKRHREQFEDMYSYAAQVEQAKKAGLSPSILFGSGASGQGGASTPQSQGVQGLQGPYANIIDPMQIAQIEQMRAETEKTKAETINIGADTEFTLANIIKTAAETDNTKQTTILLRMQTTGQELQNAALKLENEISEETKDDVLKQCRTLTEKLQRESDNLFKQNEQLDIENQLSRETYQTRVNQYLAEYKQTMTLAAKAASDIEFNDAQIQALIDRVANEQYDARTRRLSANEQMLQNQRLINQWAIENGLTEEKIKNEKWDIAMKTIASIINSGAKVAGAVISAQ